MLELYRTWFLACVLPLVSDPAYGCSQLKPVTLMGEKSLEVKGARWFIRWIFVVSETARVAPEGEEAAKNMALWSLYI